MKLTDEKVAKALGIQIFEGTGQRVGKGPYYYKSGKPGVGPLAKLPAFTTSLDAIVAEIEARGLLFYVNTFEGECEASVGHPDKDGNKYDSRHAWAKTPSLALCAALLAYLKEAKP